MNGCSTQKLGHIVELLAQCLLGGLCRIGNRVVTDSFELPLMRLDKRSLLGKQTFLALIDNLLIVANLLLDLGNKSLKGRLLEDLGFLVAVDLFLLDQFIE